MTVTVTTQREPTDVLAAIREALEGAQLASDSGAAIQKYRQKGETKVIQYLSWWFLEDYELRNRTRDHVYARISEALSGGALQGTEVTLS